VWLGLTSVASAQVATTNLVAYWKLDSAGITADAHGSNTLTNTGTTATNTGKINQAADFDGSTQYLSIADNAALSMGDIDFSGAGWVWLDVTTDQVICSKYNTSSNREYQLSYFASSGKFRLIVSNNGTATVFVESGAFSSTGTWVYVAWGHNATANDIWISTNAGTPLTTAHTTGVFNGNSDFVIAAQHGGATKLNGRVDELAIWKRDIRTDLAALYNSGSGLAYPFSSGSPGGTLRYFLQLSHARLNRQFNHFDTYGVYSLAP
jgi:hypothetical protein